MADNNLDLQLIAEVQHGNKHAFDEIVEKYQYKVFKIVLRYVNDPSEALDIVQDTFIKVYKSLPKFRGDSAFYTWLYRIAINTAKNHIISQGRKLPEITYEINEAEQKIAKSGIKEYSTPERMLICDEMEHILFEVMEELPSELRTAIMLREWEGMSYGEIAAVMGCPIGTVRSRIHRAREMIEKRVQPLLQK